MVFSQGAPRTARCIKTAKAPLALLFLSCQGAPRTARCIKAVPEQTKRS